MPSLKSSFSETRTPSGVAFRTCRSKSGCDNLHTKRSLVTIPANSPAEQPKVIKMKSEPVTFEFKEQQNRQSDPPVQTSPQASSRYMHISYTYTKIFLTTQSWTSLDFKNDFLSPSCNSYMCGMEPCKKVLKMKLVERLESLLLQVQGGEVKATDPLENYVMRICQDIETELKTYATTSTRGKGLQRSGSLRRPSMAFSDTANPPSRYNSFGGQICFVSGKSS